MVILMRWRAFSLIEVSVALGIFAFAVMGLLYLIPVALKSAALSEHETQAVHIARAIISDLSASVNNVVVGPDPATDTARITPAASAFIACTTTGSPVAAVKEAEFLTGYHLPPNAAYLAKVSLFPPDPFLPDVNVLAISVEAPAPAPHASRNRTTFVTYVRSD